MNASEVGALLQSADAAQAVAALDGLFRALVPAKYLLSSSLFPAFAAIVHRFFAAVSPSATASAPSVDASAGAAALLPLVAATRVAFELLAPSGSLFALVFFHTAFPPSYALPLSALPHALQLRVRAALEGPGRTRGRWRRCTGGRGRRTRTRCS